MIILSKEQVLKLHAGLKKPLEEVAVFVMKECWNWRVAGFLVGS